MGSVPRIYNVFPQLFSKSIPTVSPDEETLKAINILLSSGLDAIPLNTEHQTRDAGRAKINPRGISGYSVISRLTESGRASLERYITEKCEKSSLSLGTISNNDDLISLLHTFEVTGFSYAAAIEGGKLGMISIIDVLALYSTGVLTSELKVRDVASRPVTSLRRQTTLFDALSEMMRKKFRRAAISSSDRELVTERDILDFTFRGARNVPATGAWLKQKMARPISDIKLKPAPWLLSSFGLKDAARIVLKSPNGCALSDYGIITPWDLVMKPWRLGSLKILERRRI